MASTTAMEKPDPVVLGVSVPLTITLTAVKQVADAWQKFGMDFAQAVTHIRETKGSPKGDKSDKQGVADTSASAAAGVSA